jgi:hypothetical protein
MASGKQIWEEIKDKNIDVFAMTSTVAQYCEYVDIDPAKCYIVCKATAALPALETALGDKFAVSQVEKYVLVEKK